MPRYRCVVFQSTGNFVPYSGIDYMAASDAWDKYAVTEHHVVLQRHTADGWRTVSRIIR